MKRTNRDAGQRVIDSRLFTVRMDSVNEDERTIQATIASETPVNEMDWNRYEVVPRVLLASGAKFPKSRQVPLLDSHNRYSVQSQLGSIRGLSEEETTVVGTLSFSETAMDAWTKVREGHVTDVSAGFVVLKETYIPAGTTKRIKGRDFDGPLNVATEWQLYEGSITPIGADDAAKMRGLDLANLPTPSKGSFTMNPELRKRCIAAGMDANLTDEQALAWLNANQERAFPAPLQGIAAPIAPVAPVAAPAIDVDALTRSISDKLTKDIEAREALREKARQDQRAAFERDCSATLELVFGDAESVPAEVRSAAMECQTMEIARVKIAAAKKKIDAETRIGSNFQVLAGESQQEKHRLLLQTAFNVRSADLRGYGMADKIIPQDQRAKGWETFRNIRLLDFARECLMADGYSYNEVRGLSGEQIAKAAMGWPERQGLRHPGDMMGVRGYAYHVTGSLALITLDAMNKTVNSAYGEAPVTWKGPMRQAASVPDFKNKHVIKFSAAGNLPIWQDNKAPQEVAFANEKESYAVEARAETASFSWQLFVNDDQDTLSRVPALLAAAAARTVDAVAWSQVTSNPTLADGQPLFLVSATGNRKRPNLITGAATPTVLTLQALSNLMMQMRGLNTPEGNESEDILNIQPVYIVAPTALRTTVLQLVRSSADPAAAGNSGVYNPAQGLIPVFVPRLDASSAKAFYLFASPSQIDTAEVSFLQGQETPVVESYVDEATWCRKTTIVQSFAAKAIDHRGIAKHAGE